MLACPMSSPKMTRMLGFLVCAFASEPAKMSVTPAIPMKNCLISTLQCIFLLSLLETCGPRYAPTLRSETSLLLSGRRRKHRLPVALHIHDNPTLGIRFIQCLIEMHYLRLNGALVQRKTA